MTFRLIGCRRQMANNIHILKFCDEIFTLTAIIQRRTLKITRHERKPNYGQIRFIFLFILPQNCSRHESWIFYLPSLPFLEHKTVKRLENVLSFIQRPKQTVQPAQSCWLHYMPYRSTSAPNYQFIRHCWGFQFCKNMHARPEIYVDRWLIDTMQKVQICNRFFSPFDFSTGNSAT